ncbi:unnamed protein product [Larinioides sclopetarius]|uniref:Uncharacterized protein n=1 Tax=Larinioides sclopetarius TaxID=280406 RepID=A0AAV2B2B2_9ARAC
METYLAKDGKLLPKFYQDPKWKVLGSILVTVFDCMCCIATWGLAIYLMVLKSIFIIAYSLLCPFAGSVDQSEENIVELPTQVRRTSRESPLQCPSLEERPEKSRPSTPDSKACPVSKSECSLQADAPLPGSSLEDEKVTKISEVKSEASSHTNGVKDPEEPLIQIN